MSGCARTRELLPWFVNGTLEPKEKEAVESHLESCEACRAELEETRFAVAVAVQHLPTEALVARAEGREPGVDPDLFETHLAACEACAEELALLRESRDALLEDEGTPGEAPRIEGDGKGDARILEWRPPRSGDAGADSASATSTGNIGPWRRLAAAAALLAVVAGWLAVGAFRESARLAERLAEIDAPRGNIVLVDLFPDALILRGEVSDAPAAEVPEAAERVLLILSSGQVPSSGPFRAEIRDTDDRTVLVIDGLWTDADGLVTLSLEASELRGESILLLFDADSQKSEPVEAYRLRR